MQKKMIWILFNRARTSFLEIIIANFINPLKISTTGLTGQKKYLT